MSATINNNTVSFNVQETLPLLLRMVVPEEFAKYDSMTPTALDCLADYDDAVDSMQYALEASIGSHPIIYTAADVNQEPDAVAKTTPRPSTNGLVVLRQ